jgi:uncharacterized OsmC-like protein
MFSHFKHDHGNAVVKEGMLNGVCVETIENAVSEIKGDPELAKFRFLLKNVWIDGSLNHSSIEKFYGTKQKIKHNKIFELNADEPELISGTDSYANPAEQLLHSLASCLTTTLVYHASLRNIKIEALQSEVEGDIDIRGFMGLSNEVRRGYEHIRVHFKIKTDAADLEKLKELAKFSPVYDVVSRGTKVEIFIDRM